MRRNGDDGHQPTPPLISSASQRRPAHPSTAGRHASGRCAVAFAAKFDGNISEISNFDPAVGADGIDDEQQRYECSNVKTEPM